MITIGLPVYNNEEDLLDTLRSIFSQTYEDWRLIAVDDGSQDSSLDILMSINDPRVKVYHDGENKKLAHRLNEINERAQTEYIVRMDSGDMCSPIRIDRQLSFIREYGFNIVSSEMAVIDSNNRVLNFRRAPNHEITLKNYLKYGSTIGHPTIITKSSWSKNNIYSTRNRRTEDYELWVRAISSGELSERDHARLSEPLYFYRDDANVSTHQIDISFKERNEIISTYGAKVFSKNELNKILYKNKIKKIALKAVSNLNMYGKLKTSMLKDGEKEHEKKIIVQNEMDSILKTKVPGIDS
ncbi:glycosyltransferase [Shewanella sp. AS1]|uniref:glycosyltransferase family 2 protein n=1 Tax=Shewanella sp. AS1 TaxID=2907626 RepID=UPI001F1ABE8A|nr:glycosyltransferase [Shewanella sp. AS1]MCE9679178.1 glycosyltransferase [Shewanella sp. AS1]